MNIEQSIAAAVRDVLEPTVNRLVKTFGANFSAVSSGEDRERGRAAHLALALEDIARHFDAGCRPLPWEVQKDKVAEFTRLAGPGARLILSGFKDTQEDELRQRYQPGDWALDRRHTRDEWMAVLPPEQSLTWVAWRLRRRGSG